MPKNDHDHCSKAQQVQSENVVIMLYRRIVQGNYVFLVKSLAMKRNSKIYKFTAAIAILGVLVAAILYYRLPNRHKAIVKTYILQRSGMVDNQWEIDNKLQHYTMISPAFYIDGIYKSMEGPKSSNYVQLSQDSTLLWIQDFM